MNLLAFDTSTDTLSIAVQHADAVVQHTGPGGAQASASLIPEVRRLLAEAGLSFDTLDAIVFGRGPGSFTGLRTACAVAQGLAFGARGGLGVPVLPVDTLLALAEEARQQHGCTQVVAVLDARMDEVYHAPYQYIDGAWQALADLAVGLVHPAHHVQALGLGTFGGSHGARFHPAIGIFALWARVGGGPFALQQIAHDLARHRGALCAGGHRLDQQQVVAQGVPCCAGGGVEDAVHGAVSRRRPGDRGADVVVKRQPVGHAQPAALLRRRCCGGRWCGCQHRGDVHVRRQRHFAAQRLQAGQGIVGGSGRQRGFVARSGGNDPVQHHGA